MKCDCGLCNEKKFPMRYLFEDDGVQFPDPIGKAKEKLVNRLTSKVDCNEKGCPDINESTCEHPWKAAGDCDKCNPSGYVTKDSGQREKYTSGMVRDTNENKPRYDLVIPKDLPQTETMLYRWADLLRRGAVKYAERNWEKAQGEVELARFKESAFRHLMSWMCGETDEDHAAAVFFNIQGAEFVKRKMEEYDPDFIS